MLTTSPVVVSNIANTCWRACKSHPIILISASFGPSSVRVNTETVYSGRREAGVVMASTGLPNSPRLPRIPLYCIGSHDRVLSQHFSVNRQLLFGVLSPDGRNDSKGEWRIHDTQEYLFIQVFRRVDCGCAVFGNRCSRRSATNMSHD